MSEILRDDHHKLALLLEQLQSGFEHNEELPQVFQRYDLFWALLAMHIRAEHLWLFPAILNGRRELFGKGELPSYEKAAAAIANLRLDHNYFMDQLAEGIKSFREILTEASRGQDPGSKVDSISSRVKAVALRLESHNIIEEEEVYRWPLALLNDQELDELANKMKRELAELPARFRTPK